MKGRFDSNSGTASSLGVFGTSANRQPIQKFVLTILDPKGKQDRTLRYLEKLGQNMDIWAMHGRRLFPKYSTALIAIANATSHLRVRSKTVNHTKSTSDMYAMRDPLALTLLELRARRHININKTYKQMQCVAINGLNARNMARRNLFLEDRVRQLELDSTTDALTGLANRRHFDEVFSVEWNRATRSHNPLSLLMVDIDYFKKYNDHYGHHAGDQCLKRVAAVLEGCVRRAGELVARYGGEEFILLLPGVDRAEASETAEKALERMAAACIPHASTLTIRKQVSLSIGVASLLPEPALDSVAILNAADAAMYRAKSDGRARYRVASTSDWNIPNEMPRTQSSER